MSQGYGLAQVAPAMVGLGDSGTLAQFYASLTSDAPENAWPNFQAAVQNLPNGVTSDDPFGAAAQALQMGPPARLRVSSRGGIPATEVQDLLRVFEHAYN